MLHSHTTNVQQIVNCDSGTADIFSDEDLNKISVTNAKCRVQNLYQKITS